MNYDEFYNEVYKATYMKLENDAYLRIKRNPKLSEMERVYVKLSTDRNQKLDYQNSKEVHTDAFKQKVIKELFDEIDQNPDNPVEIFVREKLNNIKDQIKEVFNKIEPEYDAMFMNSEPNEILTYIAEYYASLDFESELLKKIKANDIPVSQNNFTSSNKELKQDTDNLNEVTINAKLHLTDILQNVSYWTYLKTELANKQLIDSNTGLSIDERKGNISYFIALIKHLQSKAYYKNNYKPRNEEIPIILKNTFGIDTTKNTCRQTKTENSDFKYIKYATEIVTK